MECEGTYLVWFKEVIRIDQSSARALDDRGRAGGIRRLRWSQGGPGTKGEPEI